MSAETLRRAAALMRERARIGLHSYWSPAFVREAFGAHPHVDMDADGVPETIARGSEHIASWHPAVALALSDWLEEVAERQQPTTRWGRRSHGWTGARFANAVARAYLGEDA